MCELYELAGWEGGADELSGLGTFLGSSSFLRIEIV